MDNNLYYQMPSNMQQMQDNDMQQFQIQQQVQQQLSQMQRQQPQDLLPFQQNQFNPNQFNQNQFFNQPSRPTQRHAQRQASREERATLQKLKPPELAKVTDEAAESLRMAMDAAGIPEHTRREVLGKVTQRGKGGRTPASDPRLDPTIDPKKAKRILANRISAARSKIRQKVVMETLKLPGGTEDAMALKQALNIKGPLTMRPDQVQVQDRFGGGHRFGEDLVSHQGQGQGQGLGQGLGGMRDFDPQDYEMSEDPEGLDLQETEYENLLAIEEVFTRMAEMQARNLILESRVRSLELAVSAMTSSHPLVTGLSSNGGGGMMPGGFNMGMGGAGMSAGAGSGGAMGAGMNQGLGLDPNTSSRGEMVGGMGANNQMLPMSNAPGFNNTSGIQSTTVVPPFYNNSAMQGPSGQPSTPFVGIQLPNPNQMVGSGGGGGGGPPAHIAKLHQTLGLNPPVGQVGMNPSGTHPMNDTYSQLFGNGNGGNGGNNNLYMMGQSMTQSNVTGQAAAIAAAVAGLSGTENSTHSAGGDGGHSLQGHPMLAMPIADAETNE